MKYTVHLTGAATHDLNEAVDYIDRVLMNPTAADLLLEQFEHGYHQLETQPEIHAFLQDPFLKTQGIRFFRVGHYLAFYIIRDTNIYILRFLYERRDWLSVLLDISQSK